MAKDYSVSRRLLEKALSSIPDDYALVEVKSKVKSALAKLNEIDKKKGKHQEMTQTLNLSQKLHNDIKERVSMLAPAAAKDRLAAIEQMINLEAAKIDTKPKKDQYVDMGTILG